MAGGGGPVTVTMKNTIRATAVMENFSSRR